MRENDFFRSCYDLTVFKDLRKGTNVREISQMTQRFLDEEAITFFEIAAAFVQLFSSRLNAYQFLSIAVI
jgi:hypothetical protein